MYTCALQVHQDTKARQGCTTRLMLCATRAMGQARMSMSYGCVRCAWRRLQCAGATWSVTSFATVSQLSQLAATVPQLS